MLDNRWIVPHNSYCMLWLQCHTNVECAICFASMKYINKYINKGGDCGTLTLHDHDDEVKQYVDGRYFSSMEAVWRILQFNLHGKTINKKFVSHVTESYTGQKPNVVPLQIHLPHEYKVLQIMYML